MKTPYVAGLVILAVAITAGIEEARISNLQTELAEATREVRRSDETSSIQFAADDSSSSQEPATRVRVQDRPATVASADVEESPNEEFGKTVRKMWENPAGKSMMNQGVKMAVAMLYGDFIDSLELGDEEANYLRDLLGGDTAAQQEIGMKMMSATPEERNLLLEEMKTQTKENEEAIKTFLNNDDDYQRFTDYKERLPERQQLDGIRTALAATDAPLDPATETKLVDAMFRSRNQAGVTDLSGEKGLEAIASGNISEKFEESWEKQQSTLRDEVDDILNPTQEKAFFEFQNQMKEFQLMSIKMAEKMMGPEANPE